MLVDFVDGRLVLRGLIDVENAVAGDPLLDLAKPSLHSIRADTWKWTELVDGYGLLGDGAGQRLDLYRV